MKLEGGTSTYVEGNSNNAFLKLGEWPIMQKNKKGNDEITSRERDTFTLKKMTSQERETTTKNDRI